MVLEDIDLKLFADYGFSEEFLPLEIRRIKDKIKFHESLSPNAYQDMSVYRKENRLRIANRAGFDNFNDYRIARDKVKQKRPENCMFREYFSELLDDLAQTEGVERISYKKLTKLMGGKVSINTISRYVRGIDLPGPENYEVLRGFFNLPYDNLRDLLDSL